MYLYTTTYDLDCGLPIICENVNKNKHKKLRRQKAGFLPIIYLYYKLHTILLLVMAA